MELERLTMRAQSDEPYHRKEQFGNGWITRAGCTTRERVLLRDGLDAKKGPGCAISATHWRSIYDDISVTRSSDWRGGIASNARARSRLSGGSEPGRDVQAN
jgi:hypothetical protein